MVVMLPCHLRGFNDGDVLRLIFGLQFQQFRNVRTMRVPIRHGPIVQHQPLVEHHVLEVLVHLAVQLGRRLERLELVQALGDQGLFQGDPQPLVEQSFRDVELLGPLVNPFRYVREF